MAGFSRCACRTKVRGLFFSVIIFSIIIISLPPAVSAEKADCSLQSPSLVAARSAIVVDPEMSVIYSKNPDVKLPPASTTKLVTAMVVLDRVAPEAVVRVSRNASRVHSISPRLRAHEEFTVDDLLHLALMKSINSAAVALAEEVAGTEDAFAELMNRKAVSIGAVNTRFANSSGLPEGKQYTTVYDLTVILREAIKYPLIRDILGKKEYRVVTSKGRDLYIRNTNRLLWASENVIGGKTGFTRKARHCFVGAIQTDGGPVFTAVLGTSSRYGMWKSTETLFNLGAGPESIPAVRLAMELDQGTTVKKARAFSGKNKNLRKVKYKGVRNRNAKVVRKANIVNPGKT